MEKQEIREELRNILNTVDGELLARVDVKDETPIREGLGLDSLQLAEVLFEIEDRLGIKVEDDEARTLKTVGDLLNIVAAKSA